MNYSSIDLFAPELTPEELHKTFIANGCVVLRQAIKPRLLQRISRATERAYQHNGNPVHVGEAEIMAAQRWWHTSPYAMTTSPLLDEFLKLTFGTQNFKRLLASARRIQGSDLQSATWQRPLDLHLDSFFHPFDWTVNFWVPFSPCGIDSPALQLVPVDYKTTREFSKFSVMKHHDAPYHFGHFPEGVLAVERVYEEFGPDCFIRPVMQPGDIIVSSNWVIHGTYYTPQMTRGRTSIELRYIGEKIDPG